MEIIDFLLFITSVLCMIIFGTVIIICVYKLIKNIKDYLYQLQEKEVKK